MPLLFTESRKIDDGSNDPYLVSPKGIKVQVPESRAKELLAKGFMLVDKSWAPSYAQKDPIKKEDTSRDYPLPRSVLKAEASKELDVLEVTEI